MNNKIKIFSVYFTVLLTIISISFAQSKKNDPNDKNTWDYNSDDLYNNAEIVNSNDFDWKSAKYEKVKWEKVTNFENVELSRIPKDKWPLVQQDKITGAKVAEIPEEYFDPKKILKENLKFANAKQISAQLPNFVNLKDTNPEELKKVFFEKLNADLDVTKTANVRYDLQTKRLIGDFPSYDPSQYLRDKFKQIIEGAVIIIVPLKKDGEALSEDIVKRVIIGGAEAFTRKEDGSLDVTAKQGQDTKIIGIQQGTVKLADGTIVRFENLISLGISTINPDGTLSGLNARVSLEKDGNVKQVVEGKFKRVGGAFSIESFQGKQSKYEDKITGTVVKSTGYPVAILPEGVTVPSAFGSIRNIVSYGKDFLLTKGASDVSFRDLHVFSKSEKSLFNFKNGITLAYGRLTVEDKGIAYKGLTDTTRMTRSFKDSVELVNINGINEGKLAELTRKVQVGDISKEVFLANKAGITSVVYNERGDLKIKLDQKSLALVADIEKSGIKFIFVDNNLKVELGDKKDIFEIGTDAGIKFTPTTGKPVYILSPGNVQAILGNKLFDVHGTLRELDKQIAIAKSNGEDTKQLIKKKDSLEFALVNLKSQGGLVSGKYDTAIHQVEQFLKQHPNTEIKSKAQLSLGELYFAKAVSIEPGKPIEGRLRLLGDQFPLYYKTQLFDGKERVTAWSSDGVVWMNLNELVVKDGGWKGQSPNDANKQLIQKLAKSNGDISILESEAQQRKASLEGNKVAYSADYRQAQQHFATSIGLLEEAKKDPELAIDSSLGLGKAYLLSGNSKKSEEQFMYVLENSKSNGEKSQAYTGLASTYAINKNIRTALVAVDNAIKQDPNNQNAIALRRNLEVTALDVISSAISVEKAQLAKQFEEKIGMGTNIWNRGLYESLFVSSDALLGVFGYGKETQTQALQSQLDSQQRGIMATKYLRQTGLELEQIRNLNEKQLTSIFKLPVDDPNPQVKEFAAKTLSDIKTSIADAFKNPDIQSLMATKGRQQFNFETGEGYVDKSFLQRNIVEDVLGGINVKNVAALFGPGATIKGVSLVNLFGRGVSAAAEATIGAERVAQITQTGTAIRHTLGSWRATELAAKELSTGVGVVDKSVSIAGRFGGAEAAESVVGEVVQAGASLVVNPEAAQAIGLLTESSLGHGRVFDNALNLVRAGGRVADLADTPVTRSYVLGSDGKVIAERVATFDNAELREKFFQELKRTNSEYFENIGDGAFRYEGRTYFVAVRGEAIPTKIAEQEVTTIAKVGTQTGESVPRATEPRAALEEQIDLPEIIDGRRVVGVVEVDFDELVALHQAKLAQAKAVMNGEDGVQPRSLTAEAEAVEKTFSPEIPLVEVGTDLRVKQAFVAEGINLHSEDVSNIARLLKDRVIGEDVLPLLVRVAKTDYSSLDALYKSVERSIISAGEIGEFVAIVERIGGGNVVFNNLKSGDLTKDTIRKLVRVDGIEGIGDQPFYHLALNLQKGTLNIEQATTFAQSVKELDSSSKILLTQRFVQDKLDLKLIPKIVDELKKVERKDRFDALPKIIEDTKASAPIETVEFPVVSEPTPAVKETGTRIESPQVQEFVGYQRSVTAYTDPGRVNEDIAFSDAKLGLILVADGMGGHAAGDVASRLAQKSVTEEISRFLASATSVREVEDILRNAVIKTHNEILQEGIKDIEKKGMGTTISTGLVWRDSTGENWFVGANVGDSRLYLRKANGEVIQLSKDDSHVQSLLDRGVKLTTEQAETHPQRYAITDALGLEGSGSLKSHQIIRVKLESGDTVIAMSDGVIDNLGHNGITNIIRQNHDPAKISDELIRESMRIANLPRGVNSYSKKDDISAVAMRIGSGVETSTGIITSTSTISSIPESKSWPELFEAIEQTGPLSGTKSEYTSAELKSIIQGVRRNELTIDTVTRADGLRSKVVDLLLNDPNFQPLRISEARNFAELKLILLKREFLPISGRVYSADELNTVIDAIREGKKRINELPTEGGLRDRVQQLLEKERK